MGGKWFCYGVAVFLFLCAIALSFVWISSIDGVRTGDGAGDFWVKTVIPLGGVLLTGGTGGYIVRKHYPGWHDDHTIFPKGLRNLVLPLLAIGVLLLCLSGFLGTEMHGYIMAIVGTVLIVVGGGLFTYDRCRLIPGNTVRRRLNQTAVLSRLQEHQRSVALRK